MASKTSKQSPPIEMPKYSNDTGLDIPLSPSEPGKFDFYRVHLTSQGQKNDSMFSDNYETSNPPTDMFKGWSPFANIKYLSQQSKTSASSSELFSSTIKSSTDVDVPSKTSNKPIQTVASFSSLSDAVKNAMQRGNLNPNINQLRRTGNGTTVSSKELNHLSPQSM